MSQKRGDHHEKSSFYFVNRIPLYGMFIVTYSLFRQQE